MASTGIATSVSANSKRLLDLFVQYTQTQLVFLDRDYNFIRVNDAYARACGRPADYFPGKNHFVLFPTDTKDIFDEVVASKKPFQTFARPFEFPEDPDRGVTYWDWVLIPVLDADDEVEFLVFSLVDVTENEVARRELQRYRTQLQQIQRMETLGRLAGGIAHDFNNILQAVISYGSLLEASLPDGKPERDDVREILKAGQRGQDLVAQLLTFAQKSRVDVQPMNLNIVVQDIEKLVRRLVPVEIEIKTDVEELRKCVNADAAQLEQILINLMVNSADAISGEGRITVTTRETSIDQDTVLTTGTIVAGDYLILAVEDNGSGIAARSVESIFEPFFSTKGDEGTGLGLSTVQVISKQLGGGVQVDSEVGVYTRFSVYMKAVNETPMMSAKAPMLRAAPGGRERLVFVDDDSAIMRSSERHLSLLGYEVMAFRDAREALESIETSGAAVDMAISDLAMPGMNGREFVIHLRRLRPNAAILYVSGNPEGTIGWEDKRDEATPLLVKPFTPVELAIAVREALDRRAKKISTTRELR